jgi:type VI secretion system protein ImpC
LPVHTFFLPDDGGQATKCLTEVVLRHRVEFELSNLGFLPLLHAYNTDYVVFMSTQSCQKAKVYQNNPEANASAEATTKLHYMLCVSRFAHYLKIMARDMLCANMERDDVELKLNNWIQQYVVSDPSLVNDDEKSKRPLSQARIEVRQVKDRSGIYQMVAYLTLSSQLSFSLRVRLVASVPALRY